MQVQQQTNNSNSQQKKRFHVQKWLASISKRDMVIGFMLGLLVYAIAPTLLHIGASSLADFIYSIQQPQTANAWQSIGGIIETITALLAIGAFVWSRVRRKRENKNGQKAEGSSEE